MVHVTDDDIIILQSTISISSMHGGFVYSKPDKSISITIITCTTNIIIVLWERFLLTEFTNHSCILAIIYYIYIIHPLDSTGDAPTRTLSSILEAQHIVFVVLLLLLFS